MANEEYLMSAFCPVASPDEAGLGTRVILALIVVLHIDMLK